MGSRLVLRLMTIVAVAFFFLSAARGTLDPAMSNVVSIAITIIALALFVLLYLNRYRP